MPGTKPAMATAAETREVFGNVATTLERTNKYLAEVALAGSLNLPQIERLNLAMKTLDGLEHLFRAEVTRTE